MARGGRRPGAGRPRQGITRKVSLTLTEKEWQAIEQSGQPTVAAYLKHMMNKVTETNDEKSDPIQIKEKQQSQPRGVRKRLLVLESAIFHRWKRRKSHWERLSDDPVFENDLTLRSMEEEIIFLESVIQSLRIQENEELDSFDLRSKGIQIDPNKFK